MYEVEIFCITLGMLMMFASVGIGVIIGRIKDSDQGNAEDDHNNVRNGFDNNSILHSDDTNMDNSNVGDNHGQVDSGQDLGYVPTAEQVIIVLNALPKTAHLSPHETDCVEWAAKIINRLLELLGDEDE